MRALRPSPKRMSDPEPGCPLNECLRVLAGTWTSGIIWYLSAGSRRFGDLQRDLGRVSAKVLTTRLRELERRGVVSRTVHPSKPPTVEYALTRLGERLQPLMDALAEIGNELRMDRTSEPIACQARALSAGRPPHRVASPTGQGTTSSIEALSR